MFGFKHILPVLLLANKADACPYLKRRCDTSSENNEATPNLRADRQLKGGYFYGRFFSDAEAHPFSTSAFNLIRATRPGGSFMDESGRSINGILKLPDNTTFIKFRLRGTPEAGLSGYSYLGQLLSHDVNMDFTSQLGIQVDPTTIPNGVSPLVDLDTIYGRKLAGTTAKMSGGKFDIGESMSGQLVDFPREADGTAIIADKRNDDVIILAQITVVFMKLHNKLYDEYVNAHAVMPNLESKAFAFAKEETQRNWQSVVLYDLLPELLDEEILNDIMSSSYKNMLYTGRIDEENGIPVEFSSAAYRLFHSRLASGYRLQGGGPRLLLFPSVEGENSLVGGQQLLAGQMIDWNCFFNKTVGNTAIKQGVCGGTSNAQGGHILDMLYESTLLKLSIGGPGTPPDTIIINDGTTKYTLDSEAYQLSGGTVTADLATLDIVRGQTHRVPGGIALANRVKLIGGNIDVISIEDILSDPIMSAFGLPMEYYNTTNVPQDVPLLVYLAHESIKEHQGRRLGKLGTMIVAETIKSLIKKTGSVVKKNWVSTINGLKEVTFLEIANYIGWDATNDPQPNTLF